MRGPDEAYTRLFDTEYTHVRREILVIVEDAGAAEDITQDAFVQALLHWRKVSGYERPGAWVRRVAIRLAVRHLRRERRRPSLEGQSLAAPSVPDPDPEISAAIRTLPPRQRAVVCLFYLEDRPMREVADLLGMSESTGFVHLHRARQRLGELLGEVSNDVARS